MSYITTAGLLPAKTSALSVDEARVARVQPAPEMRRMATRQGYDCFLRRISGGLCDNAASANRIELERMGRRATDECRFQEAIAELKDRLAWKAAARTNPARSDAAANSRAKQVNVA